MVRSLLSSVYIHKMAVKWHHTSFYSQQATHGITHLKHLHLILRDLEFLNNNILE